MSINALGTYTASGSLSSQLLGMFSDSQNSSSNQRAQTKTSQSLVGLLSNTTNQTQSLTEQLSGLVRLTRYAMDSMGLEKDDRVTFSKLRDYCDQIKERFEEGVQESLGNASIDPDTLVLTLENGKLSAQSSSAWNAQLAQFALDQHPELGVALANALAEEGIPSQSAFSFSLTGSGDVVAKGESQVWQGMLDPVTFSQVASTLASVHLDPKTEFTLAIQEDESIAVNAKDPAYQNLLQAFFNENTTVTADYRRIEALSGIEKARQAMALSPRDMRTRLQLESIAAWWDTQSQNTSSFGTYMGGAFSQRNGINVSV